MTAEFRMQDGIALITLTNPPVNSLNWSTRVALIEGIERANSDPSIAALVIAGSGRGFSAGADIGEFDTAGSRRAPTLWDVLEVVEAGPKPVIAALHSFALGGALELALAAHYRVALPDTKVGLPEVKLGILPGAGGTQRLPRAVGLEIAANMIVSGTPVAARELADTRLFDRMITGDLIPGAVAFAQEMAARGAPHPRLRDWPVQHANAAGFLEFARAAVSAASRQFPAPLRCLDAVDAAVKKPFEEGLQVERTAFLELLWGATSKSLRHAFLAERAATKVPDLGAKAAQPPVREVAVVGAGTMGVGIAVAVLDSGLQVTLLDTQREALGRALSAITKIYETSTAKGRLSGAQAAERMARLRSTLALEDLGEADLVIEATFEDYQVKETVFRQLDRVAKRGAILATNTSTLDVNRIAAVTSREEDVLGMHFFSPAHVMRLLEVVRGTRTGADVLATAMELAGKLGKVSVISGVCDGFIGNRMIEEYLRQAGFLLDEGALPPQIDRALEKFGFAMGPFRMSDLAGNDIGWAIRKRRNAERADGRHSRTLDLICEQGRFGQKTGAGWYDYNPHDRTAHPAAVVEDLIRGHSRSLGLTPRQITDEEIVGRLVYALVNEGARILEEGVAARASDIDLVYLHGYGFPVFRGGPMFYADTVGLHNVLRAIRGYARGYRGDAWRPAPLIQRLAETGGTFNGSAA